MMLESVDFQTIINLTNIKKIISYDDYWNMDNENKIRNKQIAIETAINSLDENITPMFNQYINELDFRNNLSNELEFIEKLQSLYRINKSHIIQFNAIYKESSNSISHDVEALKTIEEIAEKHGLELIKVGKVEDVEKDYFTNAIVTIDIFENGQNKLVEKLEHIKNIMTLTGGISVEKINCNNLVFCVLSHDIRSIEELMNFETKKTYLSKVSETKFAFLDLVLFNSILVPLLKQNLTNETFTKTIGESIFTSAYTKAMLQRHEIYANSLEKIVFTDASSINAAMFESYIEGTCIHEYISRKIDASYLKTVNDIYEKNFSIGDSLKSLEIASHKAYYSKNSLDFIKGKINNRQHKILLDNYRKEKLDTAQRNMSDFLIIDYTVNKSYRNPDFGDLFYITDNDGNNYYAALVSMPCDNSIRLPLNISCGYSAVRNNNKFELVKLNEVDVNEKAVSNFASLIFPIYHNNKFNIFKSTSELIQLPLFMLDYCSFDVTGKFPNLENEFKINDQICEKSLHFKSHLSFEYYSKLQSETQKSFNEIFKEIQLYVNDTTNDFKAAKELLHFHLSRLHGIKFFNYTYCIERVGRLRNDVAYNILKEYTSNILRIGLEATLPGDN